MRLFKGTYVYKYMSLVAFVTGITGQDGSYLAELLLEKNYIVHGLVRRTSNHSNTEKINHLLSHPNLHIHHGDVMDGMALHRILHTIANSPFTRLEIYNLAAQSHVQDSINVPEFTAHCNGTSLLYILEWIRHHPRMRDIYFYQAATSELYGKVQEWPQSETTPFYPRSPYAVAKLYAYWIVKNYRESYGLYAVNGILFNHESPRRGTDFITRKITLGLANILSGTQDVLEVGNLDAIRDWGHAKDYVRGMWHILQYPEPREWVLATGETHTVRQFIEKAFSYKGITLIWKGTGVHEVGCDAHTGRIYIRINPAYFRPAEVDKLCGNSKDAKHYLGWTLQYTFDSLVKEMVDEDVKRSLQV